MCLFKSFKVTATLGPRKGIISTSDLFKSSSISPDRALVKILMYKVMNKQVPEYISENTIRNLKSAGLGT